MNGRSVWTSLSMLTALLAAADVTALTVRVDLPPYETPANIYPTDMSQFEVTLELLNETSVNTEKIATWQLVMELVPEAESEGELLFESYTTPESSLYGEWSNPTELGDLPASQFTIIDFDTSEEFGVEIGPGESPPIISLHVSVPSDASGSFGLFIRLDEEVADNSSFWAGQDAIPQPFTNETSEPQLLRLATIHVSDGTALPGDFNGDLVVDTADYTVWRDGLYTVFEPEHYGIWKDHFGERRLGQSLSMEVPEPAGQFLVAVGICSWSRLRRRL